MGHDVHEIQSVYWVDLLSTMAVIKIIYIGISNRHIGRHQIQYLSATPIGTILFNLVVFPFKIIGVKFQSIHQEYDIYEFQETSSAQTAWQIDEGINAVQERIGNRIVSEIDIARLVNKYLKRTYPKKKILLYLKIAIATEVYDTVRNLIIFDQLALSTQGDYRNATFFVVAQPSFPNAILAEFHASTTSQIIMYVNLDFIRPFIRVIGGLSKDFIRAILRLSWKNKRWWKFTSNTTSIPEAPTAHRRRIAVNYTKGTYIGSRNDIFWSPGSGLDGNQVLVYFGRQRFPATKEAIHNAEALGLGWMIMDDWNPGRLNTDYIKDIFAATLRVAKLSVFALTTMSWSTWWLWKQMVDFERRIYFWTAFLKEHRIAVHIHHTANTSNSIPMVFAAENAGAIDIGYQWSATEFTLSVRGRVSANHVLFCWGPLFVDQMQSLNMDPDVTLISGHIFWYLAKDTASNSAQLRQSLLQPGVDYIICLLDSGFHRDIYQTPKMMTEFYKLAVDYILQDPGTLLLVKPKSSLVAEMPPNVMSILAQARSSGRCFIENENKSSFEAAMASDIAVGIGVNTAILEASLSGIPGIHFDMPGGMAKIFSGLETTSEQCVFSDSKELFQAIREHKEKRDTTLIGNHGTWLQKVDPFQDENANRRIGDYLKCYMDSIDAGLDVPQALSAANMQYAEKVGNKYVIYSQCQS